MSQPANYTPTTDFSQQEAIAASGRSTVNTAALDAEFSNIETTLDQALVNLSLLQRDDGRMKDVVVEIHTLDQAVLNLMGGFVLRGAWMGTADYAENDIVSNGEYTWACKVSHTATDPFNAANWIRFGFAGSADAAIAASQASASATASASSAALASAKAVAASESSLSALSSAGNASLYASSAATKAGEALVSATNAASLAARLPNSVAAGANKVVISNNDGSAWDYATYQEIVDEVDLSARGAEQIGFLPAGAGAVPSNVQTVLREYVSVTHFGASGNGVADCRSSIRNALLVGGRLRFPAGTYRFVVTASNDFSPLAGATIEGDGHTSVIAFESASAAFFSLINLSAGGITFRNIKITWTTPTGSAGIVGFYFGDNGNIRLENVSADLGVISVGGVQNAPNHLLSASGNASNVDIIDCYFTRFKFGVLKTNASVAVNRNWEFRGNTFENFFSPAVTFNTPSGDWDDVRVLGNQFRNNLAHTIGGSPTAFPHMGGVAGGPGSGRFIFSENVFSGTGQGLHFEEGAEEVNISGNTFAVTDIAIQILDNEVGGGRLTPDRFLINGNTIVQSGTAVTNTVTNVGIDCVYDATVQAAVRDVIITDNIIKGYTRGIQTAEEVFKYVIRSNIITNCDYGIRGGYSSGNISGNTLIDCATGFDNMANGGLVGDNTFVNCAIPFAQSGGNGLAATGADYIIDGFSLPAGSPVTIPVCPIGTRFACRATVHLSGGASRRFGVFDLLWDGTTLTGGTAIIATGSGNILPPNFTAVGGVLLLSMNNITGSAQSVRVKVAMRGGMYV